MRDLTIGQSEFDALKEFVRKSRWYWPAVFSCNERGQIWPYVTPGYTAEEDRLYVEGENPLLDDLVATYLKVRPGGGRLFIDKRGAFFYPDTHNQFVRFHFDAANTLASRTKPEIPAQWRRYHERQQDRMGRRWRKS